MTLAYRIVNWKALYEVTSKGASAKEDTPLEQLRKSAIPYLRRQVTGHSLSPTDRKLNKMAWLVGIMMEPACRDVYWELCDLAADQDDPKYRGWVLDEKQQPINAPQIAELLDWKDDGTFQRLLDILCDEEINWVRLEEFPHAPRTVGDSRGQLGKVEEPFKNETEAEERSLNLNETERDSPAFPDQGGRGVSPPHPSALVTGSVSEISDSDSDSVPRGGVGIKRRRAQAFLQLCEIIQPHSSSDRTTFRDIFDQLEERMIYQTDKPLFEKALEKARESCLVGRVPAAVFTAAMEKSPFYYIPVRKSIIRGRTDEYHKH